MTVRAIAEVLPYLGATTIWEIICRLRKLGLLSVTNQNYHGYDRTFWFDVSEEMRDAVEHDIIYFDVSVAILVGVPAAVVLRNFEYWSDECCKAGIPVKVRMSPAKLSKVLPFSEDTVKRALEDLVEAHKFSKLSTSKPIYGFPQTMEGTNPNNDTPYVTISNPLETPLKPSSKEKPSAPPFQLLSFVEKTNEDISSSVVSKACSGMKPDTDSFSTSVLLAEEATCPPADVSGEALDMEGRDALIPTLQELRLATRSFVEMVNEQKTQEALRATAENFCHSFFGIAK